MYMNIDKTRKKETLIQINDGETADRGMRGMNTGNPPV